jgi:triosephosphate isomerase
MKRTPLIAGNWKMNNNAKDGLRLVEELIAPLSTLNDVESLICPPFTSLMPISAILDGSPIKLGAQNLHWEVKGAYTGEISPSMIKELCDYVILGHSERREMFGDDDLVVNRKMLAALEVGLTPILCFGESLEENEAGRAAEILTRQIRAAMNSVEISNSSQLVLAYEPIWAIGTGRAATAEDIDVLLRTVVRPVLSGIVGEQIAQEIRILYGGSVKADNAKSYFNMAEIDGALIGGASLKADSFVGIAQAART